MSNRVSGKVNKMTPQSEYKTIKKNQKNTNELDAYHFISQCKKVFIDYRNFIKPKDLDSKITSLKKNYIKLLKKELE